MYGKDRITHHSCTSYHFDLLSGGVALNPLRLPKLADDVAVADEDNDVGDNL